MAETNSHPDSPADDDRNPAGSTGEDLMDDGADDAPTGGKAPSNLAEALDVSDESSDDGDAPRGVKA